MKTVRKHLTVGILGATLVVALVGIIGMFMTILDAFRAIDVYRAAGMEPDVGYWVSLYVVPSIIGIIVLLLTFAGCVCYIRFDMFQDTPKRENRVLHMALCATSVFMFTRMIQFFFYNSRGTAGLLGAIFHMTFFLPLAAIVVLLVRRYFDGKNAYVSKILAGVVHLLCALTALIGLIGGTSNAVETIFFIFLLILNLAGIAYHMLISPWKKYIK